MVNSPVDKHFESIRKRNPKVREAYQEFFSKMPVQVQLAIIRRKKWLSQSDVAKKTKMKQPHIARIERKSHDPRLSSVTKEAKALGCRLMVVPVEELNKFNGARYIHR